MRWLDMQRKEIKVMGWFLLLLYVVAGALGMVLIKKGGTALKVWNENGNISLTISWIFILGVIAYMLSFLVWIYILQIFPLTYISPVSYGLVFIAIAIFSKLILKTDITKEQICGAGFIILGILLASRK